jgi:hypothetical protein
VEVPLQIAINNNKVGVVPLPQQTLPVFQSTNASRRRGCRNQGLHGGQARLRKQRRTDVKISVSQPGVESGVDSNYNGYAAGMQSLDHIGAKLARAAHG